MNKLKLTFLLAFFYQLSFGQNNSTKNEISVSPINYSTNPFSFISYERPFRLKKGLNIMYKRKLNDVIGLRINQAYSTYITEPELKKTINNYSTGYEGREFYSSLGVEYRYFQNKTLSIYSGFDFTGIFCKAKEEKDSKGYRSIETVNGIALQPFTGFTFTFPKNIILSFEASLLLGVSNMKHTNLNRFEGEISEVLAHGQLFPVRLISLGYKF